MRHCNLLTVEPLHCVSVMGRHVSSLASCVAAKPRVVVLRWAVAPRSVPTWLEIAMRSILLCSMNTHILPGHVLVVKRSPLPTRFPIDCMDLGRAWRGHSFAQESGAGLELAHFLSEDYSFDFLNRSILGDVIAYNLAFTQDSNSVTD